MNNFYTILSSKTILIADDDSSTLKWLNRVLKLYFKEVYTAKDAIEALAVFEENPTDIVVSDIQMPSVDGLTLLEKISSISKDTLKVVMTAFNNEIYLNRAVKSGIDFYFKKPIDIDELLVSLASNLSKNFVEDYIDLGEGFTYNKRLKNVTKDSKLIALTKKEILLLELLIKNRYTIVSLEYIEKSLYDEPASINAIRMVIVGLRKKLYMDIVENLKGFGYRLTIKENLM
jgi:DNA-binding response OmpR family regulator